MITIMLSLLQQEDGGGIAGLFGSLLYFAFIVVLIAAMWKIFTKAGKPGWAAIVPIYNTIVLLQIIGRPLWWIVLLFIPIANLIVLVIAMIDLAKSFGKGMGFAVGLILLSPVFVPLLGFGDARYLGPAASTPAAATA
jgi:hypothetical protein